MMNEFIAKKLGEVLAFERASQELFQRGKDALSAYCGAERIEAWIAQSESQASALEASAMRLNCSEITLAKALATGKKLTEMRDMYLQDRWDDAAELMEWLGFFEGAAIVHWALVVGAGKKLSDTDTMSIAENGVANHEERIVAVKSAIADMAQKR